MERLSKNKFRYLTFSPRVLPALNLTVFDAGILIFPPVLKVPNPSRVIYPRSRQFASFAPCQAISGQRAIVFFTSLPYNPSQVGHGLRHSTGFGSIVAGNIPP
jgi:hypothetical protein